MIDFILSFSWYQFGWILLKGSAAGFVVGSVFAVAGWIKAKRSGQVL